MSTKTNFKRVALVAVAALGLGVLTSVAPASAANEFTAAGSTAPCAAAAGTSATAPRVLPVGASQIVTTDTDTDFLTITGPAKWIATTGTNNIISSDFQTVGVSGGSTAGTQTMQVTGAGAIVITKIATTGATPVNFLYASGVASCSSGLSASKSYVQVVRAADAFLTLAQWQAIQDDAGTNAAGTAITEPVLTRTSDSTIGSALDTSLDEATVFASGATAHVAIRLRDAYGINNATAGTLGVACTNNAVVNNLKGGYYSGSFTAVTSDSVTVAAATAGVPMTTTCTFQFNGVTMATKTIKFLGDLKTITLANYKNGNYDADTTTGMLVYYLKDSAGNSLGTNLVTDYAANPVYTTPTLTTATATLITNSVTSALKATGEDWNPGYASSAGVMTYNCNKYGTSSVTVYTTNSAGEVITSNAADLRCGGNVEAYSAALDKASYNTGDIATLTITGKADDGGSLGYAVAHGGTVAVSGMTPVTAPVSTDTSFKNTSTWTYTYTVNQTAGSYAASINIPVSSTSAQYNKPFTITYKIVDGGAGVSMADVLKAIVSLIASINKQIAALQKALLKK